MSIHSNQQPLLGEKNNQSATQKGLQNDDPGNNKHNVDYEQLIFNQAFKHLSPSSIEFDQFTEQNQIIKNQDEDQTHEGEVKVNQQFKTHDPKKLADILEKQFNLQKKDEVDKDIKEINQQQKNILSLFFQDGSEGEKKNYDNTDFSKSDNFINKMFDLLVQEPEANVEPENQPGNQINDKEKKKDNSSIINEKNFIQDKNKLYQPIFHQLEENKWNKKEINHIYKQLSNELNQNSKLANDQNNSIIHRSLFCSGSFDDQKWIIEANKTFIDLEDNSKTSDKTSKLKLTLNAIDTKDGQKHLRDFELNQFTENTTKEIKMKSSQWLFNQIQVGEKLMFFSIKHEKDEENNPQFEVILNDFNFIEGVHNKKLFKYSKQVLKMDKDNNEELLGAIIIPKSLEESDHLIDINQQDFLFALVCGNLDQDKNTINYKIINSSNQNKIIETININLNQKKFNDYDIVILQTSAIQMLQQFLIKKNITKNQYEDIINSIKEEINKQENEKESDKQHEIDNNDLNYQNPVQKFIKKANKLSSKDKQQHNCLVKNSMMIVYGFIHKKNLFEVGNFELIIYNTFCDVQKHLSPKDIDNCKKQIEQIFQLVSLQNSCHQASFDSQKLKPHVSGQLLCRGQIELFKSMLAYYQQKQKKSRDKHNSKEKVNDQNQETQVEEQLQVSNSQTGIEQQIGSKYVSRKILEKVNLYQKLKYLSCACFIDLIHRQLYLLIYNNQNENDQILMQIKLRNYEQFYTYEEQIEKNSMEFIKPSNYNKLFQSIVNHNSSEIHSKSDYVDKIIISNRFDNVCSNLQNIYTLNNDKISFSRLNQQQTDEQNQNNQNYLSSNINIKLTKEGKNNQGKINVVVSKDDDENQNFIYNIEKIYKQNKEHKMASVKDLRYTLDSKQEQKQIKKQSTSENQDKNDDDDNIEVQNESDYYQFKYDESYVLLQNVITKEDDRDEVPIVSIGKDFKGMQFSFWRNGQIVAIVPIHIEGDHILESMGNNINKKNYQKVVQFCASSDLEVVKYEEYYQFMQNFTIVVHFMKQSRFSMYEYQVKWTNFKKSQKQELDKQPFDIQISLIKLREVVFQEFFSHQCINEFTVVPLYEKLSLRKKTGKNNQSIYKITGIQLIMKLENNQFTYIDFRSLLDSKIYQVENQLNEINYSKQLIYAKTKRIHRFHLKGMYVETQFKHTEENNFQSDYINSGIFNDWESNQILKQANNNLLNSLPIDIIGLMNVPQILFEYQFEKATSHEEVLDISNVKKLLFGNYKKFFNTCEVIDGNVIIDNFATKKVKRTKNKVFKKLNSMIFRTKVDESEVIIKRDPQEIKLLFKELNEQQSDQYFDFIFIKNLEVPLFALSLLERVLINDEKSTRFQQFKHEGLLMDGKDVIQIDLNQESIIMKPLDDDDNMTVDIFLGQLFNNNKFTDNKYSQIMRIMAPALEKEEFQSSQFFQFFEYTFEDTIDDQTEKATQKKIDDFFIDHQDEKYIKEQECQNQIKFAQFLSDKFQDQIDRYTSEKLQVFSQKQSDSRWNFTSSDNEYKAFKLLKSLYNPIGSKFEVLATNINFQPYILGLKINLLRQSKDNLAKVRQVQFDDYDLAVLVKKIESLTNGSIEDQKVLRDIIDHQFSSTQKFYYIQFLIYVVFYFIPFWWQLDKQDQSLVCPTIIMCLIVQVIFILYEVLQLLANNTELTFNGRIIAKLLWDHFQSLWNVVDAINFIIFMIFFKYRWNHADRSLLPTFDDELKDIQSQVPYLKNQQFTQKFEMDDQSGFRFVPIINICLLMISFFKSLALLRCNQNFGELLKLVMVCFSDVQIFIIFFLAWVFIFSKLFQITGAEYGDDEYERIPMLSFYLQTFKASLGETAAPETLYWDQLQQYTRVNQGLDDDTATWTYPMIMIYIIWFIWFLNLMVNMVILLNFLIAIISTSYDKVIQNRLIFAYQMKSELNYEYYQSLRFFRRFQWLFKFKFFENWIKLQEFDLMCIVSSHTEMQIDFSEIRGMTYGIKIYMKNQLNKLQSDLNRRFQTMQKLTTQLDKKFANLMDKIESRDKQNQNNNNQAEIQKVLHELNQIHNFNKVIQDSNIDIKQSVKSMELCMEENKKKLDNQYVNIDEQRTQQEDDLNKKFKEISQQIDSEKQKREDLKKELQNEMQDFKDEIKTVIEKLSSNQEQEINDIKELKDEIKNIVNTLAQNKDQEIKELKDHMDQQIEKLGQTKEQEMKELQGQMETFIDKLAKADKPQVAYDDAEDQIEDKNEDQNDQ